FRDSRATENVTPLEHEHLAAGAREIRRCRQAVMAASDDYGVVFHFNRAADTMRIGGVRRWPSVFADWWMRRTTSMPLITRPNAAKPWPSGFLAPPKSSDGWSWMQMKKSDRAESAAVPRAIEIAPSTCFSPV